MTVMNLYFSLKKLFYRCYYGLNPELKPDRESVLADAISRQDIPYLELKDLEDDVESKLYCLRLEARLSSFSLYLLIGELLVHERILLKIIDTEGSLDLQVTGATLGMIACAVSLSIYVSVKEKKCKVTDRYLDLIKLGIRMYEHPQDWNSHGEGKDKS